MPEDHIVDFESLPASDLVVDAVFDGGTSGTIRDDPLTKLLPVGNQGGFRYKGSPRRQDVRLAVLYTTGDEADWPDELDEQTGVFTYYGDNRSPGRDLHDTQRQGNTLLSYVFELTHGSASDRAGVPPFFLFEKSGSGRRVRFRGLLAPGGSNLTPDDELAAVWRSTAGRRFQNYRARFTVLDVARVPRLWLDELAAGTSTGPNCPAEWRDWIENRKYAALIAPPTTAIRTKQEQLPDTDVGRRMLAAIREHFRGREHDFEQCAVEIWRMVAPATGRCDSTPPSRDGGRDAIGDYLLGPSGDRVGISFFLEAKCYAETNSVGVREVSRLISRLRIRDFGVLVTTSYVHRQAYQEVREDRHPVVFVAGGDIVDILRRHGLASEPAVKAWLDKQFPSAP